MSSSNFVDQIDMAMHAVSLYTPLDISFANLSLSGDPMDLDPRIPDEMQTDMRLILHQPADAATNPPYPVIGPDEMQTNTRPVLHHPADAATNPPYPNIGPPLSHWSRPEYSRLSTMPITAPPTERPLRQVTPSQVAEALSRAREIGGSTDEFGWMRTAPLSINSQYLDSVPVAGPVQNTLPSDHTSTDGLAPSSFGDNNHSRPSTLDDHRCANDNTNDDKIGNTNPSFGNGKKASAAFGKRSRNTTKRGTSRINSDHPARVTANQPILICNKPVQEYIRGRKHARPGAMGAAASRTSSRFDNIFTNILGNTAPDAGSLFRRPQASDNLIPLAGSKEEKFAYFAPGLLAREALTPVSRKRSLEDFNADEARPEEGPRPATPENSQATPYNLTIANSPTPTTPRVTLPGGWPQTTPIPTRFFDAIDGQAPRPLDQQARNPDESWVAHWGHWQSRFARAIVNGMPQIATTAARRAVNVVGTVKRRVQQVFQPRTNIERRAGDRRGGSPTGRRRLSPGNQRRNIGNVINVSNTDNRPYPDDFIDAVMFDQPHVDETMNDVNAPVENEDVTDVDDVMSDAMNESKIAPEIDGLMSDAIHEGENAPEVDDFMVDAINESQSVPNADESMIGYIVASEDYQPRADDIMSDAINQTQTQSQAHDFKFDAIHPAQVQYPFDDHMSNMTTGADSLFMPTSAVESSPSLNATFKRPAPGSNDTISRHEKRKKNRTPEDLPSLPAGLRLRDIVRPTRLDSTSVQAALDAQLAGDLQRVERINRERSAFHLPKLPSKILKHTKIEPTKRKKVITTKSILKTTKHAEPEPSSSPSAQVASSVTGNTDVKPNENENSPQPKRNRRVHFPAKPVTSERILTPKYIPPPRTPPILPRTHSHIEHLLELHAHDIRVAKAATEEDQKENVAPDITKDVTQEVVSIENVSNEEVPAIAEDDHTPTQDALAQEVEGPVPGSPVSAVSLFYPNPIPIPVGRTESLLAERWRTEERIRNASQQPARIRLERPAVRPLSHKWLERLRESMASPPSRKIVTTLSGETLTKRDLATCYTPLEWLNDEVINAYLALIIDYLRRTNNNSGRHDKPRFHAFNSFFFSNLRDKGYESVRRWATRAKIGGEALLNVDTVFVPIHDKSHWTLIVVKPGDRSIEHFDSLGGLNKSHVAIIKAWLRGELGARFIEEEWEVLPSLSPRQDNGSDCGVFLLSTAKAVAINLEPQSYGAPDSPLLRKKIVAELMNGGLDGDFDPVQGRGVML